MATNQTSVVDLPIKVLGMDSKQELLALTLIENKKLKNRLIRFSNSYKSKGDSVNIKNVNLLRIDSAKPDESKLQNASIIYLVYPDSENFGEHFYLLINSSRQFEYHTSLHVNSIDLRKIWKDNFEQKFSDISVQLQLTSGFKNILNSWITTYEDKPQEKKRVKDLCPDVEKYIQSEVESKAWQEIKDLSVEEYEEFIRNRVTSILKNGDAKKYFEHLQSLRDKEFVDLFEVKKEVFGKFNSDPYIHYALEKFYVPSDVHRLKILGKLLTYDMSSSDSEMIKERYASELEDVFSGLYSNPCDSILTHPAKEAVEKYFDVDVQLDILHTWEVSEDKTKVDAKIIEVFDKIKNEYGEGILRQVLIPLSSYVHLKTKKKGINLHFYTDTIVEKFILVDIFTNGKTNLLKLPREQHFLHAVDAFCSLNEVRDVYFINMGALGNQLQLAFGAALLPMYLMVIKSITGEVYFRFCQLETGNVVGKRCKDSNTRIVKYLPVDEIVSQTAFTMLYNKRDMVKRILPKVGISGDKDEHVENIAYAFDSLIQKCEVKNEAVEEIRKENEILEIEKFSSKYLFCGTAFRGNIPTDFYVFIRSTDVAGTKFKCTLYFVNRRFPDPVKVLFNTSEGKILRTEVGKMFKNAKFDLSNSERKAVYEFFKLK